MRASALSIARDDAIFLYDHRVPAQWVDAGSLICRRRVELSASKIVVDNFPLSIHVVSVSVRGTGTDRNFRWTGFGHSSSTGLK
jgi:hypothetical protein